MSSIDNRIVEMRFDSAQFESKAQSSLSLLDKLKQSLKLPGASKGLNDVQAAANRFNMGPMSGAVTGVSKSFMAMSAVAITAISNVTNRVIDAGMRMAKSLTLDPVMDGLREYETQLNSVQTIMSNTAHEGTKLTDVNKALQELNEYADLTIYNFSEMTRNIGTFTAAGVSLDTSVSAIKGIANLAAVSGSNSQQASTAMYQLSQALATGTVKLMDWNSVVNAGMGGKVFQDALKQTARVQGVAIDDIIEKNGSFRDSLQEGWLTADILNETLMQFAGDLNEKQLKNKGYTEEQIQAIQKMGKMATDAATKVKTASQLIEVLQEAVGSGWAQTWMTVFGDFEEAKKLWTGVSDVLTGMIDESADARNKMLADWDELGGRTAVIDAVKNAFNALMSVLGPIKAAFRDIFPAMTGQRLADMSKSLRDFTAGLTLSETASENLRRTFRGVFAVFSIVGQVIKGVVGVIGNLIGVVMKGSGGFLEFTGGIGDFLVRVDEAIKKGGLLNSFFDGLGAVLAVPIKLIQAFAGYLAELFGFNTSGLDNVTSSLEECTRVMSPLERLGARISAIFGGLSGVFGAVGRALAPLARMIGDALSGIGSALVEAFSGDNLSTTLDAINTGLFAGIVLLFRKFVKNGFDISIFGGGGDMFSSITDAFGGLTDTLSAMQANLQASTLIKIAGAVGILTASVVALSLIDSGKLTKAMTALTVAFGQLLVAMGILTKISGSAGFLKIGGIAAAMILLSTAVLILTGAVKNLSDLNWEELAKGLVGTAALLGALAAVVQPLSKNSGGMIAAGLGLVAVAGALKIMASAVKDFADLNWADMGKGLAGVAGSLTVLAGAMRIMPKGIVAQAAALVIIGGALKILASAVSSFASMAWEEMGRGMAGIAGALAIIAGAMTIMPKNILLQATALVALGGALNLIGMAIASMGGLTWEEIAKGMVGLAGSLVILAGALFLMNGSLAGSAALLVAAGALGVLAPVLAILGGMSWEAIAKGMVTLAGAFTIIGVAGLLLAPISPIILALSAALLAVGAGLALAGTSAVAFASAFAIVVGVGSAGIAVMTGIIKTFVASIPSAIGAFAKGVVEFAKVIGNGVGAFTKAFTAILTAIINAIRNALPKIGNLFLDLISTALKVLTGAIPKMVVAGAQIITGVLSGLASRAGQMVKSAADLIVNFINGISSNLGRVIDSGIKMVISFINGVADGIRNNQQAMVDAGLNLADAIIDGMVNGLKSGVGAVVNAAKNVAKGALDGAMKFLGIKSPSREFIKIGRFVTKGFAIGIRGGSNEVVAAIRTLNQAIKAEVKDLSRAVKEEQKNLEKLMKIKKKDDEDKKEIEKSQKRLERLMMKEREALVIQEEVSKVIDKRRERLLRLSKSYEKVTAEIDKATEALKAAKDARDQAEASIVSSYNTLPDITEETTVADYTQALRDEAKKTEVFLESLNKLVKMGLDDASYQKLLDEGLGAQPFIDQLIAAGPGAVEALNEATAALETAAKKLGKDASRHLHQAGVDAAEGLLKGLRSKKQRIAQEIDDLAALMVRLLKIKLKIKSPSRVFIGIGKDTVEGLAVGLRQNAKMAGTASAELGEQTVDSMREAIRKISAAVETDINSSPVISPVLDLTRIKSDASNISSLISGGSIRTDLSYGQASSISSNRASAREVVRETSTQPAAPILQFEQNNYSPRALSEVEIYRQTRNQLSMAKEALKI